MQAWRGPGSDPLALGRGKELVFCCKVEGEAFGLSWHRDAICILSAFSSICIERVRGSPWRWARRALQPHILNLTEIPRPHTLCSTSAGSSSSW